MPGPLQAIGEWWRRGVADPWQFVDSVTPGDWRQADHFNRDGLIAGVGQVATGMPAALTQPLISRMLGGQSPGAVPRINALRSNQAAGVPRIDSVIPANEQGRAVRDEVNPRVGSGDSSAPARSGGPSFGGNTMIAHSGPGGTISSQRGLGLGQLGRGGDESLAAFAASLFTRGGTQAER